MQGRFLKLWLSMGMIWREVWCLRREIERTTSWMATELSFRLLVCLFLPDAAHEKCQILSSYALALSHTRSSSLCSSLIYRVLCVVDSLMTSDWKIWAIGDFTIPSACMCGDRCCKSNSTNATWLIFSDAMFASFLRALKTPGKNAPTDPVSFLPAHAARRGH